MAGISRKKLLQAAIIAIPAPILLGGLPAIARTPSGQPLTPTPFSCDEDDDLTPPQMEGPYFKPNSPLRTSMLDGPGTRLTLTGYVFGINCQPIPGALLDFWQADNNGAYDNVGNKFRGHQLTNTQGAFSLTTIVPGLYPGRTRHIHVKVQAPGRPILTTQLYFPNEPRNSTDTLYDPALLMTVQQVGSAKQATFDFVLNVPGTPPTSPPPSASPSASASASPSPTAPGGTWQAYVAYAVGARVTYGGATYTCQIAHTSLPGWEPPNTPALWKRA
ncbi:protocatechuate 3,4-dioxygenase beta subunit [Allocatelliglobosispora scoriae]|uniref:Protocatechuate 3,4-dioxygenase beta subunit n=1 Tax=Allocatelliglobosispora scoriae TaxID=643052 RepID=A0A841BMC8_9ACTN|nr:carbohydrate-binding protein [Allocatelliglobosispora scoriae]MBB5868011.1 protocatechuate 3,4-dioxygenase beta subunit [Allocatelliglobosispora scoriae]